MARNSTWPARPNIYGVYWRPSSDALIVTLRVQQPRGTERQVELVLDREHAADLASRILELVLVAAPVVPPHPYLSTACWHGLHGRCRQTCKFCSVPCACRCHGTTRAPVVPPAHPDKLFHPVQQVWFRAGLLACREYMARFVEAESPSIANSIRANWWPSLGKDFGPPRKLDFAELTEGKYGTPSFRCKTAEEVSPTQEALPIALGFLEQSIGIAPVAKTLNDLKRCPTCKSADIIEDEPEWACMQCRERFAEPRIASLAASVATEAPQRHKFQDLREEMAPESQARAAVRTAELLTSEAPQQQDTKDDQSTRGGKGVGR